MGVETRNTPLKQAQMAAFQRSFPLASARGTCTPPLLPCQFQHAVSVHPVHV